MNSVDICNMALSQLKAKSILSMGDQSEEAMQCKRFYDVIRQNLLRRHEWSFAKRMKALTLTDHNIPGWQFAYGYPEDCLFVRMIFNEAGVKYFKDQLDYYDIYSINESERVLVCNVEKAYLEYTYDLVDVKMFPPDFVKLFYHALAAELAIPLSANEGYQSTNYSLYQKALEEAAIENHNERKEEAVFASQIMKARNEGD